MSKTAAIIGYGTAAINAIIALREEGFDGRILVLSNTEERPYSPILTSYYAGGTKTRQECFPFSQERLEELEIEVIPNCCVTGIDPETHTIYAGDTAYTYDKCLIATGSSPSCKGFPAIDGFTPKVLRTMDDGAALAESLTSDSTKRVLVSGTSMVALKTVEACLDRGVHVTLLGRSEHILKKSALPQVAQLFEDALRQQGVQLRLGQTAVNGTIEENGIEITFSDGSTDSFDDVILGHGMIPNLDFVQDSGLKMDAALLADANMRTSDPDIFVAGDVAQALNLVTGTQTVAGIWKQACIQGSCAGKTMAAELTDRGLSPACTYPGFIPNNTVYVHEATLIAGGSVELTSNRYVSTIDTENGLIACVYEPRDNHSDKLVGFNVFNSKGKPGNHVYDEGAVYLRRLAEEFHLKVHEVGAGAIANAKSNLANPRVFWEFAGHCAECGRCAKSCASLTASGLTLGGIAKAFLECDAASEDEMDLMAEIAGSFELTQAVRGCFLCTGCQQTCFANNQVLDLVHAARVEFQTLGLIPRYAWSSVQVDQEWNIFTAYRAIHGVGYSDLTRHLLPEGGIQNGFDTAFFPGCSLSSYGPELTREIFHTLEDIDPATTMITECCGSSLKSAGFYNRSTALLDRIVNEISASGAKRVVCVCPGCRNNLEDAFNRHNLNVKAITLVSFLLEHDFTPAKNLSQLKLRMSKSCQDRDGSYMQELMELMKLPEDTPIAFGGCCGAGGSVGPYNNEQKNSQIARKLSAVKDGETIVTMCPTCTYTYAFHLMENPRDIENKNYLELLFENQFDWEARSAELNSMWTGEYGPWLANVFA